MSPRIAYLLDDEPAIVDIHATVVEMCGMTPQGYTRAEDLFTSVSRFETDSVLILDLHMPGMDGIEVMRRVAGMESPPALILISGHDDSVLRSAEKLCIAHGLISLASFSKPVSLDDLKTVLEDFCRMQCDVVPLQQAEQITEDEVIGAIEENQLELFYQPQMDLASNSICGVEALARWHHPRMGLVNIESILPVAEKHGYMGRITDWVIDTAVKQERNWRMHGYDMTVSVNISASDITSLKLPEKISALLESNHLDCTRFMLEVTESALMGELVTSLDILTRLRLKGIGLSIDDFGTGYSSLSQLHRVPFTELKIDSSFVNRIEQDQEAHAIVKTCIMLGHELNMRVVTEGVENEAQLNIIRRLGSDIAQGYFIAEPMPGDAIIEWAHSERCLPLNTNRAAVTP